MFPEVFENTSKSKGGWDEKKYYHEMYEMQMNILLVYSEKINYSSSFLKTKVYPHFPQWYRS